MLALLLSCHRHGLAHAKDYLVLSVHAVFLQSFSLLPLSLLGNWMLFLYDGLKRNRINVIVTGFIFPFLYSKKKGSVACTLINFICQHIAVSWLDKNEAQKHKERFTSHSMRKGSATKCRLHPDLFFEKKYERSGLLQILAAIVTQKGTLPPSLQKTLLAGWHLTAKY